MFNKKFYLVGMTVLLSVSLFVVGCEQDPEIEYRDRPASEETDDGGGSGTPDTPPTTDVVHYDVLASSEAELQAAFDDPDVAVVGFHKAGGLTLKKDLTISKPLYLFSPVQSSRKVTVESPVYVYTNGALDVTNGVVSIQDAAAAPPAPAESVIMRSEISYDAGKGSLYVFEGGELTVADAEGVNSGSATALGTDKVTIKGTLNIKAESPAKIEAAVRFIEDKAKVTVDATSVSPSNALSLITADLVAAKNVGITAHARETADVLSILKGVDLTTNDPLASVTDLTVNGKLTARNATGAAGGLKIVVGENAEADFGTTAAKLISVIKGGATASDPGSSVALGGSLTVGDVITIADITVSGGSMFAVGNVNTITKLTLQGAATLAIGTVVNIPNAGIIVPAGATINGFKYKAQDTITAVAEFQTPSATGDREIGSGETLTVTGSTSLSGTDNKVEGTIEVPVGGALSVPENGKVTVDGDIKVDGTFLVEGEIVNNGTIEVSGTYTLDPDATYSGTGTIVVAEGGTVEVKHVSRLSAEDEAALIAEGKAAPTYTFGGLTGTVEIAEGGTLQVNAGREGDGDEEIRTLVGPAVEGDDTPAPFFQLDAAAPAAEGNPAVAAGTVTLDATTNTITVKGNVTLNSPEYGNQPRTMNIQSGEKVVIAAGATLTLEGSLNTYGTGTIDIGEGGKLVIKNEKHLIITAAKLNAIGKGRIVVQGQGNIWRAFEKTGDIPNKSLISVPGSTEDASVGLSRYTWKSCAGETNLFVVDLATKTITPSDKSELAKGEGDKDKVTLAELGFSNAWKEAVPSTAD